MSLMKSAPLRDAVDALIEKNFESEFFISAAEADRETELYRQQLLNGSPIQLSDQDYSKPLDETVAEPEKLSGPFD